MNIMTKNGIVPIKMTYTDFTFTRNGRTIFIDVVSVNKGLMMRYPGGSIPKIWSAPAHRYVLHSFKIKRTRRNSENFKYSTKDAVMDEFVLTFNENHDKLFTDITDDEKAHGNNLQTILETTCASELFNVGTLKLLV
jgi:hypothetical protein